MNLQATHAWEFLVPLTTAERLFVCVCPFMGLQVNCLSKLLVTLRAFEWFFICMRSLMRLQLTGRWKLFFTKWTFEASFRCLHDQWYQLMEEWNLIKSSFHKLCCSNAILNIQCTSISQRCSIQNIGLLPGLLMNNTPIYQKDRQFLED